MEDPSNLQEMKERYLEGEVLLLDKPLEWSSFHVVNHVRWTLRKAFNLKKIKVGHAGTLDPLATGLLVLCTGKFTRKLSDIQGQEKEYTGCFRLGATTPSYDLETPIDNEYPTAHITEELILKTAKEMTGLIQQVPPIFSAVRKEGKRLYEYARKGDKVTVQPREVEIFAFEITEIQIPDVTFRVVCSKGTYIRSLAHDFGIAVGSGAHLTALRRTKIGDYHVNNALTPKEFRAKFLDEEANS